MGSDDLAQLGQGLAQVHAGVGFRHIGPQQSGQGGAGVGGAGGSQVEQQGLGLAAAETGQENVVTAHVYPTE